MSGYNKNFWNEIKKPIIALAPMENYTDSAFRRVCKQLNPEIIVVTEFTSADGIHYNSQKTKQKFAFFPDEQPLIAQVFGKRIDSFVTAAKFCEDKGFAGVDINMGCPVKKILKAEHGVALRKNLSLACKLVDAVAKNTKLAVSVKTRLGMENSDDLIEFGKAIENSGANLITIHGRTYKEMYTGPGNWEAIYALKEELNIPVVGNGGVKSLKDGFEKLKNLDGFMIGRAAVGNPWLFSTKQEISNFSDKVDIIKKHARYLIEDKGEKVGTLEIRNHLLSYVREIHGAKHYRVRLTQVKSLKEIEAILDEIVEVNQELLKEEKLI